MLTLQKLVSFAIHACCVVLVHLPFSSASHQHVKAVSSHTSNKHDSHKLRSQLSFEITVHGLLLWASMGFLMPIGILTIRMSNRVECGRRLKILFYAHAILQTLSVLLGTAGAVMSIRNFENSFNNNHQRIGLALYGIVWLQAFLGLLRPQRGTKGRSVWFFVHWVLGTAVSLLGIINIYTGLQAYHKKASRSIKLWTTVFTAEVSFIVFLYLFQEKWEYIQKQGVILGNEPIIHTHQEISLKDKQKESLSEPC